MAAVTCLVPDLGDHLVVAMVRMQEMFAALDDDGMTLPPPLSGEFAIAAARRVELALTATQTRTHWPAPPGTTFTGPEGQQVVCLRQVEQDRSRRGLDLAIERAIGPEEAHEGHASTRWASAATFSLMQAATTSASLV